MNLYTFIYISWGFLQVCFDCLEHIVGFTLLMLTPTMHYLYMAQASHVSQTIDLICESSQYRTADALAHSSKATLRILPLARRDRAIHQTVNDDGVASLFCLTSSAYTGKSEHLQLVAGQCIDNGQDWPPGTCRASDGHMQSHAPRDAADNDEKSTAMTELDESIQAPEELPFNAPLSHELFLSNSLITNSGEFDASAFLLTRKHLSLDDLRSELRTYLQTLRNQLKTIINNDYEDFINLGGSHLLGSEDQMSIRMRKPIESILKEIKECKLNLEDIRSQLSIKLKRRELVRKRKLVCRKLLGVNDQVIKVEEMLLISDHSNSSGNGDYPHDQNALTPGNALAVKNNARRVSTLAKKVDR